MNATRFLLVGAPALVLTLMAPAAFAQQADIVDPDKDVIAIEDLESLKNPEEPMDIIADRDDADRDVIAIEDLESLANPEEFEDIIQDADAIRIEGVSGSTARRERARERRAARREAVSRSEDNACYHAPFSRLSYCQSWVQSN